MHFLALFAALGVPFALAAPARQAEPTSPATFPTNIQSAIVSFEGQVQTVIADYAQNANEQTTITDYSSTGRAFDFYLRNNFLPQGPSGCPQAGQPLPPSSNNNTALAIGYLQQTQLALIAVSQDAIIGDFSRGVDDFCQVIRLYGAAARNY